MLKEQSDLTETQQLLEYVSMMITKMFPDDVLPYPFPSPDGLMAMETQQYETNMAACDAYISKLSKENEDLKTRENDLHSNSNPSNKDERQHENDSLRQEIEELNKKIEFLENGANASQDSSRLQEKFQQLQHHLQEKDVMMENIVQENTDLKTKMSSLEGTVQETQQNFSHNVKKEDIESHTADNKELYAQIETLTRQLTELQTYSENYQTQNQQLSQQLSEMEVQNTATQQELQGHVTSLNQQLQQYQQFTQTRQAESEHLKRLNTAAMAQGPDQEVAMRMELQNQVNVLTNENQHYQSEYENLRQGWMKYQQESNAYIESVQSQYQQLQVQYQQLETNTQQAGAPTTTSITTAGEGGAAISAVAAGEGSSNAQHEKMHNLSLLLTEKAEECVRYQQENDQLKAQLVEIQNDASDMELIREECKQLKTMLMSKEHESRVDETISMLQTECKQLKNMLAAKESEMEHIQKSSVEKDNELSDMELLKEECKQLKLMLVNKEPSAHVQQLEDEKSRLESVLQTKEANLQRMNASLIDMQNSTSDMELLREECSQLKQMLMNQTPVAVEPSSQSQNSADLNDSVRRQLESQLSEKDHELRSKNAVIAELQNTSGDVELLRQQCEQLKTMLSERDQSSSLLLQNNAGMESSNAGMESSFLVQVQQLEEVMKEKDDVITQKNEELYRKDTIIVELQNNTSDMELLHNECRALKEMISGKEKVFAELQNDLDLSNDMIGQRNYELSQKTAEMDELSRQLTELRSVLGDKDREFETLREEMAEAVLQDENIHLLQTEYRNVEEHLKSTQLELQDTQQKLFDVETHCERMKVYEKQYEDLKQTLKEREEELSTLRLQSSESSILESETVALLHQELNQLKSIVYEREQQVNELNNVLEKKNLELQNLSMTYNHTSEMLHNEGHQKNSMHQQFEELTKENNRLAHACQERDRLVQDVSAREGNLRAELDRLSQELSAKNQQNYDQTFDAFKTKNEQLHRNIEELTVQTQTQEQTLNQQYTQINQLQQQIHDSETTKIRLEQERVELENVNGQYVSTISELQTAMRNLQSHLQQMQQNQQNLLQSNSSQQNTSAAEESIEALQNQQQVMDTLIRNLRSLLQLPELVDRDNDVYTSGLSEIIQKVQWLLNDFEQKEAAMNRLQSDSHATIEKYRTELSEKLNTVSEVENKMSSLQTEHAQALQEKDFKNTDLQSQLLEFNELESMYQQKCNECEHLQQQAAVAIPTTEVLQMSSANNHAEYEQLRDELARNSHSLLDKNKECDRLKLNILQLEEKLFTQQQALSQLQNAETQLAQMDQLKSLCQAKDVELQNLQSQLEDSYAMLEGGKKEKQFLDQLVKEKNSIVTEKEELTFQNSQLSSRLKELEVEVTRKEIEAKEIESKTKRELERLRNHLMMVGFFSDVWKIASVIETLLSICFVL